MTSPFTALNAAAIRAERRQKRALIAANLFLTALLALAVFLIARATLTLALGLPDVLAQAATLKGM